MDQAQLGAYADGDDEDRPVTAEAAAIAGDDEVADDGVTDIDDHRFSSVTETVEIAVMQVDYTVEGRGSDEHPVVHVFGRTQNNTLVHARVFEFKPYFYAPASEATEARLREYDRITGWEHTDENGDPYESIRGEKLVKIFGQTPRDVGSIRDEFDHFEADILFPNRFLIDKDITSGLRLPARAVETDADRQTLRVHHEEVEPADVDAEPRVNTFDIEVDDRAGFPEDGEEPIICITSHDSYTDEYVLWLYDAQEGTEPPDVLDEYDPIETDSRERSDERVGLDTEIRVFDTEEAMLAAFLDYLGDTDCDVATGWNFTDFDAPYLLDRLEVLEGGTDHDLRPDRLSRVDEVWRSSWQGPNVKGRVMFDLLYAYRRTKFTELESYRLEDVGQRELGIGKERYAGDIGDLWENDPERLLEYNLRDVELCVELDREQDIIAFWNEVRQFVGCKLEDATTPGDAVDMYVLHKLHDQFALPSKGQRESEEYEGGAVFDPITGVRENVSVLDLKCFSSDTEVLTPNGSVDITDIEEGDPVYTLNPETFECEVKPVVDTHEYENRFGELHHLSGNTHDFKVTENHRFLVSAARGWDDQTPADFEFVEYGDITDGERFAFPQHEPMEGRLPEQFRLVDEVTDGYVVVYCDDDLRRFRNRIPDAVTESLTLVHGSSAAMGIQKKAGKYLIPVSVYHEHRETIQTHADNLFLKYGRQHRETPLSFEMGDWLELLGWFVTEGSTDPERGRLTLHQTEGADREAICDLLDRMGVQHSTNAGGVNVSNQYLLDWLETNCGEGYADKHLPEWVFDLDAELLTTLLDTMIRGDGSRTDSGLGKFWTKSDALKHDIVDLAVRCGQKPTVSKQSDGTWYVSIGKKGSFKKETNATVEDHDGTVHCLTAQDNHVVLAGRNGHFQWVGQSLYPMCMVTINASPETKVDPESYGGETYHAPNGTRFRKEPDGAIREMVDELLAERDEKKGLRDDHDPDEQAYEQYDRQQAAVKVIMNCFTPDTEVLTPDGVRNIRELDVGDVVYSLDPETMEMEVKPVVETQAYPDYRGELVDIETSKIDFRVTPNHRMLVRKNDTNGITEDGWTFKEAGNLYDYCHYEMPHNWDFKHTDRFSETIDIVELAKDHIDAEITLSDGGTMAAAKHGTPNISRTVPTEDFLTFLAWYITEGSVYEAKTANYRIKIAQEESSQRGTIASIVERLVDYYYTDDRSVSFSSRIWAELLTELCGSGSAGKRIPELVFKASGEQKRSFLETLIAGDGDWQKNAWRFSTTSQQLRDDVMRLCTHLGLTANYTQEGTTWRIYCTEDSKNSFRMYRAGSESTADNGVYCVTVKDNSTLLAGRNGTFQNLGNSLYGVLGWDRFRLYDKEMGAAVTATGREVIEHTEDVTNKLDKEVIYGDSVTGDRPVVVRDTEATVRIVPVEELFERARERGETTLHTSANGTVRVDSTPKEYASLKGWDALSLSSEGETEWQPIERVIRHETSKDVLTLRHKVGESTTTRDHAYVVEDENEYRAVEPESVDEPLRVPSFPAVEKRETIDVYEVLHGYEREYEDGRGGNPGETVTKTKRVHADEQHVWFGHEHHGELESTPKVKRYIGLKGEDGHALIRLLAAYAAEGSASTQETASSRFGASIAEERFEWLEGLRNDYERLFTNVTSSVIKSDTGEQRTLTYETEEGATEVVYEDTTQKIQMMNELAAVFFREFAGQTSRGKRVPSFVFHLPEREQDMFLTVLIEGDGSRKFPRYSESYAQRNFDLETTSRKLAAGVAMLLIQRDEKYSLKYRPEKDSYTIRTCDSYGRGRDPIYTKVDHDGYVYDLSVAENENFVDGVGGIVLHNTDSVMVSVGKDVSKEAAIERSFEIEEEINDSYDEFASERLNAAHHRFEIEFEKLYERFFQAGKKKRYAGRIVWKEGKDVDDIDITGFEYQRSDIASITKEVQREVIEMIVTGADIETVKSYVTEIIEDFQKGNMDPERIGIPGGIGKRLNNYDTDTAQVRGAKYANLLLGTNFQRGSKPKRLYLDRVHSNFFERVEREQHLDPAEDVLYGEFKRDPDVICFEYADQLPEAFEIDWEKMLDKTLKGPIERILEALNVSWEEVKSGQDQMGLGDYM